MKDMIRIQTKLDGEVDARKRSGRPYERIHTSLHGVAVGSTGLNPTMADISLGL